MNIKEIWKTITEAPKYKISNFGRIKSYCDPKHEIILKQASDKDGYKKVSLSIGNQKRIYRRVHRLVAMAFLENPNNYQIVNHLDGDVTNNHVSNLEWCNNSQNQLHSWRELNRTWDNTRKNRQYTFTPVKAINLLTNQELKFDCINDCARYFQIDDCCIHNRLKGRCNNPSNSPQSKVNNWFFTAINKDLNDHSIGL